MDGGRSAGEVFDGDIDSSEVLRGLILGGLKDDDLQGGVPEKDEMLGSVEGGDGSTMAGAKGEKKKRRKGSGRK